MADVKISGLPAATTPVAGTEVLPIVQSTTTKKLTIADITPGLSIIQVAKGGTGTATPALVAGTNVTISGSWPNQTINASGVTAVTGSGNIASSGGTTPNITFTGQLPVANGGTGTATPSIVAGTNVTVSGTWPNQTINATGGSGGGDVSGPASSTDNAVARFDSTTGKIIQNSGVVINDSGEVTVGVWKGTEIGLPYGGTGASTASQARGNILPSYAGNAGKVLAVNTGATDVEYIAVGGSGTVTSVAMSGGTTGLTTSGGPITASGTITLGGTLAVASGGTGTSTPAIVAGTNVTVSGSWPNQTINAIAAAQVYPSAGIANSTGTAWGTSYTTTGSGTVVALATSPTITAPLLNQINDTSNNQILNFSPTTSAVDYLVVKNGIGVGVPLHFYAEGASSNIGLHIQPKGTGLVTISDGTDFNKGIRFRSSSSAASAVTLLDAVSSAGRVVTLPDATTTLVGRDTTDTLTNKTINLTSNTLVATSAQMAAAVSDETGSGSLVFATSPTLVTPILGTPQSATLTNATGLPIGTGVSGLGTGVATALAVNIGTAGSAVVNGGALGTPSSGTLTNATGLPIATGVSGLGTGVATFLTTPSSANLISVVSDETGSGVLVFNSAPALTNPTITNYVETPFSANSSTAITLALTNGTVQIITLTGTCTITMPTAVSGKSFMLLLKTGAGAYTVTWSTVQWPSGTAPTLTATASKMDKFVFTSDGTNWYGSVAGQNFSV
jgi:hypothetical protein